MKNPWTFVTLTLAIMLNSCGGSGNKKSKDVSDWNISGAPGVYVLGSAPYTHPSSNDPVSLPTLWKDGTEQHLTNLVASCSSLFASGNDVYIAGTIGSIATLWKNGTHQTLEAGQPNSVFVSGNDVYLAGCVAENIAGDWEWNAVLWKNGVRQTLSSGGTNSANSVFVSGGDVYVAGTSGYSSRAVLWKNGIQQTLGSGDANSSFVANSVFVSGNDVYVAGNDGDNYDNNKATLWKNGTAQRLTNGGGNSYANSVIVVE